MSSSIVFGDIPADFSRYRQARVVILPVPYEQTTSYLKGTAKGPEAILKAAEQIELFDEKLKIEPFRMGIHILPFMEADAKPAEFFFTQIENEVLTHLRKQKLVVILGGEHTITLAGVKGAKRVYPDLGVVQIDAHADLRDSYQNNPYSHACVMRRVFEYAPVFQIAIRSISREEYEFMKEKKIVTLFQHELAEESLKSFLAQLPREIYLTIDLDGFDPAVIPGVGNPEPGGLTWSMVDRLLEEMTDRVLIRAFDIVELRPIPQEARSEITAVRLLYRLLGYIYRQQCRPQT